MKTIAHNLDNYNKVVNLGLFDRHETIEPTTKAVEKVDGSKSEAKA